MFQYSPDKDTEDSGTDKRLMQNIDPWLLVNVPCRIHHLISVIVTAQQQPQPLKQNSQNCSWVEQSYHWKPSNPPLLTTTNSKLHDRAQIEQYS